MTLTRTYRISKGAKAWILSAVYETPSAVGSTRLGTYQTRKAALTVASLLAGRTGTIEVAGAEKVTITAEHGVGDLNALIGDRVVAVAFYDTLDPLEWRIYHVADGGGPRCTVRGKAEARKALVRVAKGRV